MTGVASPGATKDKDGETPTPALFDHVKRTYDAMLRKATQREGDGGITMIVWEGHLTHLIVQDLNLSSPYYTKVTRALKEMGCARQLRRGGSSGLSLWELIKEPTEEGLAEIMDADLKKKKANVGALGMLEERVNNMNDRLLIMEKAFENILKEEQ